MASPSGISAPLPASSASTPGSARTLKRPASSSTPSSFSFFTPMTQQFVIPTHLAPAALQICLTAFPLGLLAGLVLPRAVHFLSLEIWSAPFSRSSASDESSPWYLLPQLHLYLFSWCLFHLLEFIITAAYNPTRLFSDSFLLNNGIGYHIAHFAGLLEFVVTATLIRPEWKKPGLSTVVGLVLVLLGQTIRSLAMIHASSNFSHIVADKKREDHRLVKTGVYSFTRHPSYVGFFYWALGTQVLLGNYLGFVAFAVVLWRFFSSRIKVEEKHLIEFFKDEYVQYKKEVGTHLPFIQ